MKYTTVNKVSSTDLKHEDKPWAEVNECLFSRHSLTVDRDKHWLFTGWELKPDEEAVRTTADNGFNWYSRCIDNCVALHFLTLDVDNDDQKLAAKGLERISFDEVQTALEGLDAVLYTSYNHLVVPGQHRLRVVLPLAQPITKQEYTAREQSIRALFPWAASESFTPSQPYWPPLMHPARRELARLVHQPGELLDLLALQPDPPLEIRVHTAPSCVRTSVGDDTKDLILSRLIEVAAAGHLDNYKGKNGSEAWLTCGAALYNEGYPVSAFQAVSWSGEAQRACERLYKHWRRKPVKISGGYLINLIRNTIEPTFLMKGHYTARDSSASSAPINNVIMTKAEFYAAKLRKKHD